MLLNRHKILYDDDNNNKGLLFYETVFSWTFNNDENLHI